MGATDIWFGTEKKGGSVLHDILTGYDLKLRLNEKTSLVQCSEAPACKSVAPANNGEVFSSVLSVLAALSLVMVTSLLVTVLKMLRMELKRNVLQKSGNFRLKLIAFLC